MINLFSVSGLILPQFPCNLSAENYYIQKRILMLKCFPLIIMEEEKFEQLKETAKKEYEALIEIRCPYFNENIKFTSEGFQHMLFKGASKLKMRDRSTQIMRLKLFKLAAELLRITKTVQEYHLQKQFITVTHHNKKETVLKDVEYWGFIAILHARKIKVVVKQTGNGAKKFWSIIPNWRTGKSDDVCNHTGDLEND